MAQEKIIIKFEAKGNKALVNAIRELDNATRDLKNEVRRYGKEGGKWVKNNRLLNNSLATLRSKLLLVNFAMAMGIRQIIRFAKEAAKVQSMERAFISLSGGTLNATDAMEKLRKATNGTMSQFDLFQQANNAMILGVSRNSDEMAEMFDIAQRLGRALGRDTRSSVESLITGIGRQSRLMLDNIGIITKVDKANQAYADNLGITTEQLSDSQKKQAFLNATMEAARDKASKLNPEVRNTQMIFDNYNASMANLSVEVGTAFIPVMEMAAEILITIADSIDADEIQRFATALGIAGAAAFILSGNLSKAAKALTAFNIAQAKTGWGALATMIGVASFAAMDYFGAFEGGKDVTDEFNGSVEEQNELLEQNRKLLLALTEEENKMTAAASMLFNLRLGMLDVDVQLHALKTRELQIQELLAEGLGNEIALTTELSNISIKRLKLEKKAELELAQTKLKTTSQALKGGAALLGMNEKNYRAVAHLQAVAALVDAYSAAQSQFAQVSKIAPPPFPQIAYAAAIAQGIGQAHQIVSAADKMEQGGIIGGRRHSQGGTMINAEQGEFVMRRDAVEAIGIENLNRMNEGGGGGMINVSVTGNVLTQDFVEEELAEAIRDAARRGTDFGIS